MFRIVLTFLFSLCLTITSIAQDPAKTNELIEGGKLFIEILKIFKKQENNQIQNSDCFEKDMGEFKIKNELNYRIWLKIKSATNIDKELKELIVPRNREAKLFNIKSGIFILEISTMDKQKPIMKTEIKIEPCKQTFIKLKE